MTTKLNISIAGIAGRMGRQLAKVAEDCGHSLTGGSEAHTDWIGRPLTDLGIGLASERLIEASASAAMQDADTWIDFTAPVATLAALDAASSAGTRTAIIGTTGFDAAQEAQIAAHAKSLVIVKAGNFSLGVNLLQTLVEKAASALGPDWDIEILETHHRRKVDAPSGTALMLGNAAASGRDADLSDLKARPYDGPDARRIPGEIGFAVRRSGGVFGEHEVTFGSDQEVISLSHTALNRAVFAHGALKAAEWAAGKPVGLYDMKDVLSL